MRDAAARERDDERVSTRPREGEKPSTLHICSIIHHIPRSVAHTHTHSANESPNTQRKSLSRMQARTPKTEDHIANKNTHYRIDKYPIYISKDN